jgi:hypothetical protein
LTDSHLNEKGVFMSFLKKLFATSEANRESALPNAERIAVPYDIELIPNTQYRTTRQMYLFTKQAIAPDVNDYLLIGAVVTYLRSGDMLEDNHLLAPWVKVRSSKGREGWCFAHYLVPATEEDLIKARKKERRSTKYTTEHWARAEEAIAIWNSH